MKYEAVIFDFDYTLADTTRGIVESFYYGFDQMKRVRPDEEAIKQTIGMTLHNAYLLLAEGSNDEEATLFRKHFRVKANEVMTAYTELFPDTMKVLKMLKSQGVKLAIVSSKDHSRLDEWLERDGLQGFFDAIVGGEEVKAAKPDPEGTERAIGLMGISKEKVLYVGDSIIDAQTAQNAGVDFVAVTTGTTKAEAFETFPCYEITSCLAEMMQKFIEIV